MLQNYVSLITAFASQARNVHEGAEEKPRKNWKGFSAICEGEEC